MFKLKRKFVKYLPSELWQHIFLNLDLTSMRTKIYNLVRKTLLLHPCDCGDKDHDNFDRIVILGRSVL